MDLVEMLGELLKDYSDVSVSQLTGIERTRINRIRKGKFRIEFDELNKIISSFVLDEKTAKKLYDAYLFEKLGKDRYNSRQMAKDFLLNLSYLEDKTKDIFSGASKPEINADFDIDGDVMVLNEKNNIRYALNCIIIKSISEGDSIRIISSPFNEFVISNILSAVLYSPDLRIEHIFSLSSINELTQPLTYYMGVAKAVYPIFMENANYNAYYSLVGHATNALMPYYVMSGRYSINIAPDGSSAILTKSKDIIELHKKLFSERKKQCSTFFKKINSTEEYIKHYCSIMEHVAAGSVVSENTYYSIDFEPCVLSFLNQQELGGCIERVNENKELAQLLVKFVSSFFETFKNNKQISFFTKRGLTSFMETGKIAEIPDTLGLVLPMERRCEIIECVINKIKDNSSKKVYYMFNEDEFDPPLGLRFLGAGTKADHLFVISNGNNGIRSILSFTNKDILSGVFDFIESLPESEMVYSQQETIDCLEAALKKYKK